MKNYSVSQRGDITVITGPHAGEKDIEAACAPVSKGEAAGVFVAGSGHDGIFDRLLVLAIRVLTGAKLSTAAHLCYAVRTDVFQKLNVTESGSGLTAELAAKLTDRKLKCTEVKSETPHPQLRNLIPAAWSLLVHCPLTSYGAVGLLSTIVEWVIFWLLDNITTAGVAISTAVAFILSTVFNWYLGRAWTFKAHADSTKDIIPVCIVSAIGLALSELIMLLFTSAFGWPNFLSKVLTTVLVFFWNYLARKKLVYTHK